MSPARTAEHVGMIFHDDDDLGTRLAPHVAAALARGERAVVWAGPAVARALRAALAPTGPSRSRLAVLDPVALQADGDTVARQLRALTARGPRALVVAPSVLVHAHRPALARLADDHHLLVCTCPHDAAPAVVADFRVHHSRLLLGAVPGPATTIPAALDPRPPAPTRDEEILDLVVETPAQYRDLRVRLGGALDDHGFDVATRRRDVLAVHEAAVAAWQLGERWAPSDPPARRAVRVRARIVDGELVADVETADGPGVVGSSGPSDPLRIPRAFCTEVSWSGTLRVRRIRLRFPAPA